MTDVFEVKKLIGYCGIYCGGCGMYKGRIITKVADDLKELVEAYGYPEWVPEFGRIDFDFQEFQKGLAYFTKKNSGCYCQKSCKDGGGLPGCEIKKCAEERGVEICFQCDDYPCEHIYQFLKRHPEIAKEYERFKKLGLEEWMKTQVEKASKGYCQHTRKYYTSARIE